MNNNISIEKLKNMSYTEFISYSHQWNIPPGSFSTLSEWITFGRIDKSSRVLEIACTTGFSSREIAKITGCSAVGIDICKASIEIAKFNKEKYGKELDLKYFCEDAYKFKSKEKFTHIILGAALGFFEKPQCILENLNDLLVDGGIILVSPYYLKNEELSKELIEKTKNIIQIIPTNFDYYTAIKPYENFEVLYESRKNIIPENKNQMIKYCSDTVNMACEINGISDNNIKQYMFDRMYEIKDVCNELHKKFGYSVMVLRYRKDIYPNRFVELF